MLVYGIYGKGIIMVYNRVAMLYRKLSTKVIILMLLGISGFIAPTLYNLTFLTHPGYSELDQSDMSLRFHIATVENFFRHRLIWPCSKLGGILFKREEIPRPNPNQNKTYSILIWKHWNWLKERHVFNFNSARHNEENVLLDCSVKNCVFSGDDNLIETADAVVVHLQKGNIPTVEKRNPNQIWIFLNDESPKNAFTLSKRKWQIKDLDNVFNWSMTYRSDADVPVPYGRTIPLDVALMSNMDLVQISQLVPNWTKKRRDVPATLLMSNCGVKERNDILNSLRQYIKVDVYGACSDNDKYKKSCPGHFRSDCEPVSTYVFYLVLENSNCFQYLTEKVFYHAYAKGAVPIIWGPSRHDIETLLPPNSYLYIDKDTNLKALTDDILTLANNDELLLSMHMWRNDFKVVNEHGYFGTKSYHLCRLCEAMNYNEKTETIYNETDLKWFLDPSVTCTT